MSFCDGVHVSDMPPVQDHKRAFEGNTGPNTGGMGSYSDANGLLPFLVQKDLDDAHEITVQVAAALKKETGVMFKGIMYGGFMKTKNGVKLIEYNARFGDPESMNVLPILKTDFVSVCEAILDGTLDKLKIEYEKKATVCKYLVPEGYPEKPRAGERIVIASEAKQSNEAKMYYSSVDQKADGLYTSSSRAIAFVGIADTLEQAEKIAESACSGVKGPVFHRKDIGTRALISSSSSNISR
jgi:phosphoribosylamine--glycine ligase